MPPGAPGRYVIADLQGRDVAAIGSAGPPAGRAAGDAAGWHTYIATDDTDEATARLVGLGATVVGEPADAGPGGRLAVLHDREGAEFRLWQGRGRPGAQLTNAHGSWNFSDLHTGDPSVAEDFYGPGFGWVFADLGYGTAIQVPGYGDHLAATVDPDIHTRQAAAPAGFADVIGGLVSLHDEPPHWHVTFAVANRDTAAADAERLGATVLRSGQSDWTRTALVGDPQDAVFTVSQFTPDG